MEKLLAITLCCLISLSVFAEKIDTDRYKGYQFSPQYDANSEQLKIEGRSLVNQHLLEEYPTGWRNVSKIRGAGLWGDRTVVGYTVGRTKGKVLERESYFKDCKDYYEKFKKKKPSCVFKSNAISTFIDGTYETDILVGQRRVGLFSNGHYGRDYYGCIDLKPLFIAPLIEGKGDALFTITGVGNHLDSIVSDRLTLSIYGESLNATTVKEDLMLINMLWSKITEPTKHNLQYNFLAGEEVPKGHILDIPDNRARKKYAKMYVSDFNEDGLLELLFWHRQYYSTLIEDKERVGFIFEKEWYSYYVESYGTDGFNDQPIDNSQGKQILTDHDLKWRDGYPDNQICEQTKYYEHYPMMQKVLDDTLH